MNGSLLGEQIARFRKALDMTQEDLGKAVGVSAQAVSCWECGGTPDVTLLPAVADTLGVTVDALFGREIGEKIDIEDTVRRWMLTVPQGQRVDRLCRLVWAAAGPVMSGKPEDKLDISGCEACCESETTEDGKVSRWLRRTRIIMEDGCILGVRAGDMSFAAVFPEPEAGWEAFLESCELYRRLFAVLALPHCLELLEFLYRKPLLTGRRYTPGAIAKPMGIPAEEAERLMDALAELKLLSRAELETEDGVISAYLLGDETGLVPFLYFARWLTTNVKQMERLAWEPFFSCVQQGGLIVWCILALLSLHWIMLAAGLVSAAVMLVIPKLFQKRMERLGEDCAAAEAEGVSKLKDLLSGFDVLRSFGHVGRFLDQGGAVSDRMEEPHCRRSCAQSCISCFTGFFSVSLQILQQVVTVVLAFQGKIILGAIVSAQFTRVFDL